MVCRESRLSSAFTTFARGATGLEDNQVLSLNHALMQEGAQTEAPTREQWNALIDDAISRYDSGDLVGTAGTRNLRGRLEAARDETPDGPRYYAAQRLVQRATQTRQSHHDYIYSYASRLGITPQQAEETFRRHFSDASNDPHLRPSRRFGESFRSIDSRQNLLQDRRSNYAYQQMEEAANTQFDTRAEPSVRRRSVESSAIAEMGYDPETGRVEVVMRSNPDRVYAYRMTPQEYERFENAQSIGSYYARHVRGNSDYSFESAEASLDSATRQQCPTCGRWATRSGHSCPPTGSDEAMAQDARNAAARRRGETPPASRPVVTNTRPHVHLADSDLGRGAIRMPGRARLQQEARRHGSVETRVFATYFYGNGNFFSVSGHVAIGYNGRGQGYTVEAVTRDNTVEQERSLRCSCAEYRANYDCPHVRETVARVTAHVRGEEVDRAAMRNAVTQVETGLQTEYAAASATIEADEAAWVPSGTNMEQDSAEFQAIYDEAREARARYKAAIEAGEDAEFPVPYLTENAFGGLSTRENGRGFGTEFEFSFPDDMPYEERQRALDSIARKLYDEGLTDSNVQKHYGASHGWYRDHHERGWSFEQDPTVNGGEIVSPVMYDEPETWENINKICTILKEHGASTSGNAGMHVHVGTGEYDHDVANHTRLLAIRAENEDLIYRMSMNPERMRHRGTSWCGPNRTTVGPYRSVSDASNHNTGHHLGFNMQSVRGRDDDHVEYRTFDGTLNPAVIQSQIGMAVYMSAAGSRSNSIDPATAERHPLGERVEQNPNRRNLTGEEWDESTKTIRRFIDRYVPGNRGVEGKDNPRVRQMVSMYAVTKWVRGNSRRAR